VRVGYQIADLAGGMFLAMACLGAMLKALRSGKGDHIQISLLDCQLALLTWQAQNYFISGDVPKANGARHPVIAPSDIYPCADGNFIAISPTGQGFWKQFCSSIGKPELADDERFAHPKGRVAHVQELTAILTETFQSRTAEEWGRHLLLDRVPASPVNDVKSALDQEIAVQRKMVESLQHPGGAGALNFLGNPFKFNGAEPLSWPPVHGEQTSEILTDLLGYDETRVAQLIANSIVYQGEKRNDKTK
jgi:CoA:oxalate CoA-transferase